MDCYSCSTPCPPAVPLLTCSHCLCSACYVEQKQLKINTCLVCARKLKRGNKRIR